MRKVVLCLGLLGWLVDSPALATYSFRGLGDLPGGNSYSVAWGVSGAGLAVAGEGASTAGTEALRWTPGEGPSRGSPWVFNITPILGRYVRMQLECPIPSPRDLT
jgi:hypothetical protein